MAVRIRLTRTGRTNFPSHRIAVFDSRTRRDGKYLENLGTYNPREKDDMKKIIVNTERLKYWVSVGAQPTESLLSVFKKCKIKVK
jgi:small subunit ribosomal protein S16